MFYSAKAGCTSMRNLFLKLHADELEEEQAAKRVAYHNLNEIFPYQSDKNYSDYYQFCISRNPFGRVVSAFLDQYTYAQNSGVQRMLANTPPEDGPPQTFVDFLEYLKDVPDELRDSHFQTQSYYGHSIKVKVTRNWFKRYYYRDKPCVTLNYAGDVSSFNKSMQKAYDKIFRREPEMHKKAMYELSQIKKMNSSFYGKETYENAATLTLTELDQLVFAPKPQDFYTDNRVRELVREIYAQDFKLFGYDSSVIPQKKFSPEIEAVPDDFDWQVYLLLAPDLRLLGLDKERTVVRHFLQFGQFEIDSSRFYKIEAPEGFVWQNYIAAHGDLVAAGIDNERDAIIHYLSHGFNEGRDMGNS